MEKANKLDLELLVLDMDGTAHHMLGGLVEANIEPIKLTIENGINVFFVTGRPVLAKLNMLEKVAVADNKHSIVVGCNGACIYDYRKNQILESNPLPFKKAKAIFDLVENNEKYKGIAIWAYVNDLQTSVLNMPIENNKHLLEEGKFFDGEILNYQDVKDNFNFDCFKLIIFDANKKFYDDLRANFELNISTNNNIVAEINEKGINKQFAIKWFEKHLNIDKKVIAAMGDGMNDFPMIEYVGYGISMENSHDEIKKIADIHIAKTNDEGAVKEFITQYILGDK